MGITGNNNVAGFTPPMGQFNSMANLGINPDSQPGGLPRGHGRRHSVNVVNKSSTSQNSVGSVSFPYTGQDGFDDGFTSPFGGHSRTTSRVDSSWRISAYSFLPSYASLTYLTQMVALSKAITHLLLISHKRKLSYKVCNNSVLPLVVITTRCHRFLSRTCYRT